MKVTVLGSGTCTSQLSGVSNRQPPAFLVEWDGGMMLFECSEGVRFRLEQAGVRYADVRQLAISHAHPDHCAAAHFVQSVFCSGIWSGEKNASIDIHCPPQIERGFGALWDFHFPETEGKRFPWPELRFHTATAARVIGSAKLSAFPVHHGFGRCEAFAFRLEAPSGTFAYSGDTGDCEGVRQAAKDADIFICEASSRVGDEKNSAEYGHLSPMQAGAIARDAGAARLYLFHYTGLDSDQAMAADASAAGYDGAIVICKDLDVYRHPDEPRD